MNYLHRWPVTFVKITATSTISRATLSIIQLSLVIFSALMPTKLLLSLSLNSQLQILWLILRRIKPITPQDLITELSNNLRS